MDRRGSQEAAQGSHPTCQGLVLEESSCPDRAVLAEARGPFGSLWLPLSSPRWCPASTVGDLRLSSPAPGLSGVCFYFAL